MNILLWIYGCSWALILLLIVYAWISTKRFPLADDSKLIWLLILIFGPISAILILFVAIAGHFEGKKQEEVNRKNREEREREEKAENEKREQTTGRFNIAFSKGAVAYDEKWVLISRMLHKDVDNKKYDSLLSSLYCVSLPKGLKLDVELCEHKGSGDKSKLIVVDTRGQYSLDIFKYLRIVPSPAGAWQAYLLYNLWHSLPLFWHAVYASRQYVYTRQDLTTIKTYSNLNLVDLIDDSIDLAPQIYQLGNDFYVSSCYWSEWGGLIREYVEVRFDDNKVVQIYLFAGKKLYEYDCEIML